MKYEANQKLISTTYLSYLIFLWRFSALYMEIWEWFTQFEYFRVQDFSVVPRAYLSIYIYVFITIYLGQYAPREGDRYALFLSSRQDAAPWDHHHRQNRRRDRQGWLFNFECFKINLHFFIYNSMFLVQCQVSSMVTFFKVFLICSNPCIFCSKSWYSALNPLYAAQPPDILL